METNRGRIAIACLIVFVYLLVVNAMIFPLVFPDGLAEKFVNLRPEPFNSFHILAFAATAILLTWLTATRPGNGYSLRDGATTGGLLGLLVALPEHLH